MVGVPTRSVSDNVAAALASRTLIRGIEIRARDAVGCEVRGDAAGECDGAGADTVGERLSLRAFELRILGSGVIAASSLRGSPSIPSFCTAARNATRSPFVITVDWVLPLPIATFVPSP